MNRVQELLAKTRGWILFGLAALILATRAGAVAQTETPLTIRWIHTKPDAISMETDRGDVALDDHGSYFTGAIPPSNRHQRYWPLIIRYGQREAKLLIELRLPPPNLTINLPYPAPGYCHESYVRAARAAPTSRESALYQMMMAHHLLQLASPDDCDSDFRSELLQIRWHRNLYLVRNTTYYATVPEYAQELRADLERRRLDAHLPPNQRAQAVAVLRQVDDADRQMYAISVERTYDAQQAARLRGDIVLARDMLNDLATLSASDPRWRQAVVDQRVNLARDLTALNRAVELQGSR